VYFQLGIQEYPYVKTIGYTLVREKNNALKSRMSSTCRAQEEISCS